MKYNVMERYDYYCTVCRTIAETAQPYPRIWGCKTGNINTATEKELPSLRLYHNNN